eukprot:157482-Amphidinium_carterae.1
MLERCLLCGSRASCSQVRTPAVDALGTVFFARDSGVVYALHDYNHDGFINAELGEVSCVCICMLHYSRVSDLTPELRSHHSFSSSMSDIYTV